MREILVNQVLFLTVILLILLVLWLLVIPVKKVLRVAFPLKRLHHNPLLSPNELNDWESQAVFNPGAFMDDEGFVHLLYRAIGLDGLSKIGHAKSSDGKNFERMFGYPVYQKNHVAENAVAEKERRYNPHLFASGGGWGGCEDPRTVRIDDKVYMSYTAFEGWHSVRIALTSIGLDDFKKGRWNWKKPSILSAPNTVEKNWVLFPEKINGKFAVLHSISPNIKIDYLDDIENTGNKFIVSQNSPTKGGREEHWDTWMRGAAAPPLRTRLGWLLLYHAMDKEDPNKYKLGAMILDEKEPTKILYRSVAPILSPEMPYENDWKPGVIYASGAVIMGDDLHVYYGGGDKHICSAHANLEELLNWLVEHGRV